MAFLQQEGEFPVPRPEIVEIEGLEPSELYRRALPLRPFWALLDSGFEPRPKGPILLSQRCFLAFDPFLVLSVRGRRVALREMGRTRRFEADPFSVLERILRRFRLPHDDLPTPLPAGGIGYLSYDLRTLLERVPPHPNDDLKVPDMLFCFYDSVLTLDLPEGKAWLVSTGLPFEGDEAKRRARERVERWLKVLDGRDKAAPQAEGIRSPTAGGITLFSNFDREGYKRAILKAKHYIRQGDIFQVNLSQRFCAELTKPPFELFLRLREVSPAPFAAFLDFGEFQVVSSSPERFLFLDPRTRKVHTRPIKGTRPRGRTAEEDRALASELLASEKDRAEHVMIVDLERNDLGGVAEPGTVKVVELYALEPFPTVFHLTSTIEGRLREDVSRVDLLRATFPGGSITGAPKVRAMEIINELETVARGIYTGALGYLSFSGFMDLSIVIRTAVVRGGWAYLHAGGGIVFDSDPEAEYEETLDKARGLVAALGLSERRAVRVVAAG